MKNVKSVFLMFFIFSIALHLLILFSIYHPNTVITIIFTAGMFFSWIFVSKRLKDLAGKNPDFHILQHFKNFLPVNKYLLLLFALYAFVNFAFTMSLDSGTGWVDFELGHDKLRGISGFWVFFFLLGYTFQKENANLLSESR